MRCPECKKGYLLVTKEAITTFGFNSKGKVDWREEKATSECCWYDKDMRIYCSGCDANVSHNWHSSEEMNTIYDQIRKGDL